MREYKDETYGDRISEVYDDFYGDCDPVAIEMLVELAGDGPALELGIGTGRVALPLQARGVAVQGIDASREMISKLRSKEGGTGIEVLTGSFAEFKIDGGFRLIYVVFNTFFALLSQREQIACFRSVSEHLAPAGAFVMEVFVPDLGRFVDGQTVRTVELAEDTVHLEVSQINPVAQQVTSQHVVLAKEGVTLYPVKLRYAWPTELDLMAQIAGLSLRQRWSSWSKQPFTAESKKHISVYGHADQVEFG